MKINCTRNLVQIICRLLAVPALLVLTPGAVFADTITGTGWKGTTSSAWSAAGNWDATAPSTGGSGDRNLFFGQGYATAGGTGNLTANNDLTSWAGYRITFQDIGSDSSGANDKSFTLTGNGFTLYDFGSGTYPRIENDSFVGQNFNLTSGQTLGLQGNQTAGQQFAEIDPVNGDITFSATTKIDLLSITQLRIYGSNAKNLTFNGIISSSGNSGANTVSINQNSSVIFGAANTYTGDTFINAGTLQINSGGSANSSTFRLGDTIANSPAATLSLASGATISSLFNTRASASGTQGTRTIASTAISGTATASGNIYLDADATISSASGGTFAFTGSTFDLKNQTLTVNGAGNTTIGNVLQNSTGAGKLTKTGAGMLTLNGAAVNTYTGGTTVNAGTLIEDFSNISPSSTANLINSGSALSLGGGTLQIKGNSSSASSQTFASCTLNAGISVVSAAPASGANNPTAVLNGLTENLGGTVEFVGPATVNSSGNVAATSTLTTTTVGGGVFGAVGGFGVGKNGAYATVGLYDFASTSLANGTAGTSPYTILGGSQVTGFYQTASVATTTAAFDVPSSGGTLSLGNASGSPMVRFNVAAAKTITFTVTTANGIQGFLVTPTCGANNQRLYNNGAAGNGVEFIRSTSAGNCYGVMWQNDTLAYLNVDCSLNGGRQSGQNNGLVQAGPGTVVYSQSNPYELATYLNGGCSMVTADSAFGSVATGSALNLNGGTVVGNATFTMDNTGANKRAVTLGNNGGGLAATAGNTMTIDGVVSGAAGPLTIGIPANSANQSVLGLLPGSGTAGVSGVTTTTANGTAVFANGTVLLNSGANTYSGGTVLASGTLQFTSGSLGTGGVTFSGGTLQWASSTTTDISSQTVTVNNVSGNTIDVNGNTVTLANAIGNSGSGALAVGSTASGGVLNLSAANTYTGGTTIGSNTTLNVNNGTGSGTGSGNVTVNSGGTLAGSGTISGNVTVSGAVSGSLTISGNVTLNSSGTLTGTGTVGGTLANSGTIAPGSSGVGQLTVGSLTMASGSYYNFEFNSTPANDKIVVSTASGLVLNGGAFNLYAAGGTSPWIITGTATYNLIQYSGSISGSTTSGGNLDSTWTTDNASNPHVANPQAGFTYKFGTSGGWLTLTITQTATVGSWNVNGDGNWSTAGNWSGGVPGANTGSSGDVATFAGVTTTAARTVTLDANEAVGSITMNQANSFTIADGGLGHTLTLDNRNAGATLTASAGTTNAIGTAVALKDNTTATVSSGKSLSVSGIIANAPSVTKTLTINGAGTLALSGNNSYGPSPGSTGTTLSGSGTLQVGNNNALGAGDLSVTASGTIQAGAAGLSLTNNIAVASSMVATVANNGNNLTLTTGVISGSGALSKINSGTLTLGGANTYSGGTAIGAGVVSVSADGASGGSAGNLGMVPASATTNVVLNGGDLLGSGTFALHTNRTIGIGLATGAVGANGFIDAASGQTFTINGAIASAGNTGTNNLVVNSIASTPGTVLLNATNVYNGTTTVNGGILRLGNSFALQNSTLNYNNQGGVLSFGSLTAATLGGLSGAQNLGITNGTGAAVALTLGNNSTDSSYSGLLSGSGSMIKLGTGTLTLANPGHTGNTYVYSGGLNITGGTLSSHLDLSAQYGTVNASISGATVTSSSGLYITSPSPGSGGGGVYGSAGNLTITNGAQVTANADGNGRAISYGNGGNFRPGGNGSLTIGTTGDITTLVTANGALDMFATAGGGTTGNFTVNLNGGTLAVNSIKETTYGSQSGTFKFNGGTLKALTNDLISLFIPATPSQFTTPVYAGGAIIDANGFSITIGSVLAHGGGTPDGGLTKLGSGTLTLTNANSYTGLTTINAGTLNINSEFALGGANYSGLTFNGGTLQYAATLLNSTTDISTKPVTLNSNATVDVNGNVINFANPIGNGGSGALTVKSTLANGMLSLQGASTYKGATTITNVTLLVNNTSGAGTGTNAVTVQSGATLGGTGTIGGATTLLPGAVLTPGNGGIGTLTFTNSLSLNAASTNGFVVTSTGGASNKVAVAGALLTPNSSIIKVASGTPLQQGTNTLFTYGSISGSFNPTVVFDVAPVHSASLVDDHAGHINLVVPNQAPVAGSSFTMGVTLGIPSTVRIVGGKHSPTDADSDALTITSVSGYTNSTVTTDGTNITCTATNGMVDSFTYTVSDGCGGVASQTISVTISSGEGSNRINAQVIGGNEVLTYLGIPGTNYALEVTHDLTPPPTWTPVVTNTAAGDGTLNFTNTPSGGSDFYRTRYVP